MPGAGRSGRSSGKHLPPRPLVLTALVVATAIVATIFHGDNELEAEAPFDFWVLSLSWMPTFCGDPENADSAQCGDGRGFGVHGLWPQFEGGRYPEFCDAAFSPPTRADLDQVRDLFPDPGLARHQWNKHGSCAGLSAEEYYLVTRSAVDAVAIPDAFTAPAGSQRLSPDAVEAAFRDANPDLRADAMSVDCGGNRLEEVRICLTYAMDFRACPEVDRRSCRARSVAVPGPQ